MGQFYDEIPAFFIPWIQQQKMFWVATAPLNQSGHVNLSPKGFEGTFNIMDQRTVWYEDMSGSGAFIHDLVVRSVFPMLIFSKA
jgi:hypothetical protein